MEIINELTTKAVAQVTMVIFHFSEGRFPEAVLYHVQEGMVTFAQRHCIIIQKALYHLPEVMVSFARSHCIICPK